MEHSGGQEVQEIENRMVDDDWWDEIEYHEPSRRRLKREHDSYEELERGEDEDD